MEIVKLSSEAQLEALAEGRLDVGLLRLPVLRQREGVSIVPLFSERLLLDDLHGDAGAMIQIATDCIEQPAAQGNGAGVAQAQGAQLAGAHLGCHVAGFAQFDQQVPGPRVKGFAGGSQPWLASSAFEQRGVESALHLLDLPAQGRLGHEQSFGGSTEAAGFCNFDEVAQLADGEHESCLFEMGRRR